MFGKLATLIACVAACGGWLLSLRHERVQALSELTQAQLRINRQDERLWMLRTQVAERITPPRIEALAAGMVDLQPIVPSQVFTPDQLAMIKQGKGTGPELIGPPGPSATEEASQIAMANGRRTSGGEGAAQAKGGVAGRSAPKASSPKGSASKSEGRRQSTSSGSASKSSKAAVKVARRDRNGEEN